MCVPLNSDPLQSILSAIADLESMINMYKETGMATDRMEAILAELRQSAGALEDGMAVVK